MTENCIFCKIAAGEAPADLIYQDEQATAFRDRRPAAPVHMLIIPNRHIPSIDHINSEDEQLLSHLILVARDLARQLGLNGSGYRLVFNTGADAGQTVFHVHLHLLGGRPLGGLAR